LVGNSELAARIPFLLNRILLEEASNEDGIEIRSDLSDRAIHKATYPAVPAVVELEPILSGGFRMQLDHRPVATDEYMFHIQLCAFR
jgi:hypothetical protein